MFGRNFLHLNQVKCHHNHNMKKRPNPLEALLDKALRATPPMAREYMQVHRLVCGLVYFIKKFGTMNIIITAKIKIESILSFFAMCIDAYIKIIAANCHLVGSKSK